MTKYFSQPAFLFIIILASCNTAPKKKPVELVQTFLENFSDSLAIALNDLNHSVIQNRPSAELQTKFEIARRYYKHVEPFSELYFPGFSDAINGPAIDESEIYEGKVVEASGFQVVEEYLYPQLDSSMHADLLRETRILAAMTNRLKQLVIGNELTDAHAFQAIRLQLVRITSLGLSGFDSPIAQRSLPEAVAALEGIEQLLSLYESDLSSDKNMLSNKIKKEFKRAYEHIGNNNDFNTFDRAGFISDNMVNLSGLIHEYQRELGIPNRETIAGINLDAANVLDVHAVHLPYFSNPINREQKPELVNLGKLLFFDPILSGNHQRSCASCHQPSKAFTDGRVKSLAFGGKGEIKRNAPTIINSAFQRMQFYDSRTMFQEDQVMDVVTDAQELHGQIDEAVKTIKNSKQYAALFDNAFGTNGESVTARHVQMALAGYVRSLSSTNAAFDRYMRGDKSAMSVEEISGFNIFMGKGKCGTCHFTPLFNGTIPPLYTKSESEVLGVPIKPDTIRAKPDPDLGKFLIFGGDLNRNAFKTPTLRNVALTAPYMHNGVFNTLEEVIDFYNRGGGEGIGVHLPNQTLPPDRLDLTNREKEMLIAFMRALTDTTGLSSVPKQLPLFNDRRLASRKIGGTY